MSWEYGRSFSPWLFILCTALQLTSVIPLLLCAVAVHHSKGENGFITLSFEWTLTLGLTFTNKHNKVMILVFISGLKSMRCFDFLPFVKPDSEKPK